MFYRRKIILSLIEAFGGNISKIKLFKLLLIVTKGQQKPDYHFVPYQYGCYSFSLNADLDVMCKRGILREDEGKTLFKVDSKIYFQDLKEQDKKNIRQVSSSFSNTSTDDIIRYTYLNYPYTATKSQIAEKLLSKDQLALIRKEISADQDILLFTIGYEGISLEEYLNRLIRNNIKVLVDVRKNPISMKFGFSKNQLLTFCGKLGIEYIHIPEVGIQSDLRQALNSQTDYDNLFNIYKSKNLSQTFAHQQKILDLLITKKRIALTCFEANICQCHRKHLSEAITRLPGWNYELKHI